MSNDNPNNNAGDIINNGITNLIDGFFSPQNAELLSSIIGIRLSKTLLTKAIQNNIKVFGNMIDIGKLLIGEVEEGFFLNMSIIIAGFFDIIDTYIIGGVKYSLYSISLLLNGGLDLLELFDTPMMILMLISTIMDSWDPCGFDTEINSAAVSKFSNLFDTVFMEKILSISYYTPEWPSEYYADSIITSSYVDKTEYNKKIIKYSTLYLSNLATNSNGIIVCTPPPQSLITMSDFDKLENQLMLLLADNNTVVENWFYRFWPLILFIVILIFIFIFAIR